MCMFQPPQKTIEQRQPFPSEIEFFNRTKIPGYAADDNRIVMNPMDLPGVDKEAVKKNEALRIYIRQEQPELPDLTAEQKEYIRSNPSYSGADEYSQRATILGRLASGDPTGGTPSEAQKDFLKKTTSKYKIK